MIKNKDMMEIEVKGKTYLLGYPTRQDAIRAENAGLDVTNIKVLSMTEVLFYSGLLAKQPEITREEANEIMDNYIEANGDLEEITKFLTEQYVAFTQSPNGTKKKKAKIIKM